MTDDDLRKEVARLNDEVAVTKTALFALLLALSEENPDLVRRVAVDLAGIAVSPVLGIVSREDHASVERVIGLSEEFADNLLAALGNQ